MSSLRQCEPGLFLQCSATAVGGMTVILERDARSVLGYRIHTAYIDP